MKGSNKDDNRLIIDSANGAWVTDVDGNQYLDGMSGLWCVNIGYGRQELAQAAFNQLNQMSYFPLAHGHKPAIELAEKLNNYLNDEYVFSFQIVVLKRMKQHLKLLDSIMNKKVKGLERNSFLAIDRIMVILWEL